MHSDLVHVSQSKALDKGQWEGKSIGYCCVNISG